jgi:hypothetical protein
MTGFFLKFPGQYFREALAGGNGFRQIRTNRKQS